MAGSTLELMPTPYDDDFPKWKRIIGAGENKARQDRGDFDRYVKLFKDGKFPVANGSTERQGVSVNQTFAYIMMVSAMLYSQAPAIEVEPRDGGDASSFGPVAGMFGGDPQNARRAFAEGLEGYLTYAYEEQGGDQQSNAGIFETLARGQAVSKASFDYKREMHRIDTLRRDEVFVDPHARFSMSQCDYIMHTSVMKFEKAREFFDTFGVRLEKPNFKLSGIEGLEAEKMRKLGEGQSEADQFKFYEIWCKKGDKRHIYYATPDSVKWLHQRDWPFTLDQDDFPFAFLHFNTQFCGIQDAFPEIQVVDGLQEMYEEAMEFNRRHVLRGLAQTVLLDGDVFDDDLIKVIQNSRDLQFRGVKKGNKKWEELVHIVDLNNGREPALELAQVSKDAKDEILGFDELQRSAAQEKLTATQAEILDEYGKLRQGQRQKQVDAWLTKQLRQGAQIARQLVSPEKIAKIVGQNEALLWSLYAGNADDFLSEYSVGVAAGSTGERARAQKLKKLADWMEAGVAYNGRRLAMIPPQFPDFDEKQVLLEMGRVNNIRRPERNFIEAPPPAVMPPPPVVDPAAAAAGAPDPAPPGLQGPGPVNPAEPAVPGLPGIGGGLAA